MPSLHLFGLVYMQYICNYHVAYKYTIQLAHARPTMHCIGLAIVLYDTTVVDREDSRSPGQLSWTVETTIDLPSINLIIPAHPQTFLVPTQVQYLGFPLSAMLVLRLVQSAEKCHCTFWVCQSLCWHTRFCVHLYGRFLALNLDFWTCVKLDF